MKATFILSISRTIPHFFGWSAGPNFVFADVLRYYASSANHSAPAYLNPRHDNTMSADPNIVSHHKGLFDITLITDGNRPDIKTMVVGQQVGICAHETVVAYLHGTHHGQMSSLAQKHPFPDCERRLFQFIFSDPNQAVPLNFRSGTNRNPLKGIGISGQNQIARNGRQSIGFFSPKIEAFPLPPTQDGL
jgi:hypothetical protein